MGRTHRLSATLSLFLLILGLFIAFSSFFVPGSILSTLSCGSHLLFFLCNSLSMLLLGRRFLARLAQRQAECIRNNVSYSSVDSENERTWRAAHAGLRPYRPGATLLRRGQRTRDRCRTPYRLCRQRHRDGCACHRSSASKERTRGRQMRDGWKGGTRYVEQAITPHSQVSISSLHTWPKRVKGQTSVRGSTTLHVRVWRSSTESSLLFWRPKGTTTGEKAGLIQSKRYNVETKKITQSRTNATGGKTMCCSKGK